MSTAIKTLDGSPTELPLGTVQVTASVDPGGDSSTGTFNAASQNWSDETNPWPKLFLVTYPDSFAGRSVKDAKITAANGDNLYPCGSPVNDPPAASQPYSVWVQTWVQWPQGVTAWPDQLQFTITVTFSPADPPNG